MRIINDLKGIVKAIKIQLFIFFILLVSYSLPLLGVNFSFNDFWVLLHNLFNNNGYYIAFIFSFLDNFILANTYFPGSFVILSAMSLTHGHLLKAIITFLCIYSASFVAQILNFIIGKKMKPDSNIEHSNNYYWLMFLSTMWHPQFAALTSLKVGSDLIPFKLYLKYYIPTSLFWNTFWGILMYKIGLFENSSSFFQYIFLGSLILWMLIDIIKYITKKH